MSTRWSKQNIQTPDADNLDNTSSGASSDEEAVPSLFSRAIERHEQDEESVK
jgi:hypothetical protein